MQANLRMIALVLFAVSMTGCERRAGTGSSRAQTSPPNRACRQPPPASSIISTRTPAGFAP